MRKLTDHIVNPVNDRTDISVMDEPGSGGAHHHYEIYVDGSDIASVGIFSKTVRSVKTALTVSRKKSCSQSLRTGFAAFRKDRSAAKPTRAP